ncbi:DUF5763 domain-containing protein [Flavihumibacter fluvii]|uniref:DUF5763 domain-containing protein n=1 Tax=Flavihumibacter fluvii TaxID=2838157 RepID=UPI001BDE4FA7|nr:DUF5763 domain-containing protein [Flavihumibacter fluvii]ULQ51949.1 DUF5763 domain-containing protein [Flavihumibacter fluvii]
MDKRNHKISLKYFIVLVAVLWVPFISYAQSLYKTPSGTKYHLGECRMVKNVSQKVTVEQIPEFGLEPCKICKPEIVHVLTASPGNKAKGQNETVQCKGLTKKGTRCKHMTSIGNGYCFQHNPDK